ncbi:DUF2550 domain-containing protein [Corynebacterium lubricantis]|uniref:DUF2550 domain-containing protein n=1 Tax=Corynebacterium lubricantis TaxID=541095 RepID=UPI00039ED206|nr:DUF2550 domain-containing protein [Corynebacterium lubricantis]
MELLGWVFIALAVICMALGALRFFALRSRGSTVLLRVLPASGNHGWRHGKIQYSGDTLSYYKLRSLIPRADIILDRTYLSVEGHRELGTSEREFMPTAVRILTVKSDSATYEIAATRHIIMALISWIESAPDPRQEKTDYKSLTQRIGRQREQG